MTGTATCTGQIVLDRPGMISATSYVLLILQRLLEHALALGPRPGGGMLGGSGLAPWLRFVHSLGQIVGGPEGISDLWPKK